MTLCIPQHKCFSSSGYIIVVSCNSEIINLTRHTLWLIRHVISSRPPIIAVIANNTLVVWELRCREMQFTRLSAVYLLMKYHIAMKRFLLALSEHWEKKHKQCSECKLSINIITWEFPSKSIPTTKSWILTYLLQENRGVTLFWCSWSRYLPSPLVSLHSN